MRKNISKVPSFQVTKFPKELSYKVIRVSSLNTKKDMTVSKVTKFECECEQCHVQLFTPKKQKGKFQTGCPASPIGLGGGQPLTPCYNMVRKMKKSTKIKKTVRKGKENPQHSKHSKKNVSKIPGSQLQSFQRFRVAMLSKSQPQEHYDIDSPMSSRGGRRRYRL